MNEWRRLCGPIRLLMPAAFATRRTMRAAASRVIRSPLAPTNRGPSARSPMARSNARGAGSERDRDGLAALVVHDQGPMTALEAELFDVGAERLGDPQPVQSQQ